MQSLRAEFPVLDHTAYLNAGTNGPVPRQAAEAACESLRRQAEEGRGGRPFFDALLQSAEDLRGRAATLLGCDRAEVALTGSTTDGVNSVLGAIGLSKGDEVLTSDEEHPGLLAPLAALRERAGVGVRVVPFAELAGEIGAGTRLVACSHVSWQTGRVADVPALAAGGVPVLLDGAQGLGAVATDVRALGCDFYAASGQKWLCGPNGIGYLYVRSDRVAGLPAPWPGYHALANGEGALEPTLHSDARRLATGLPAAHDLAFAHAALDVLEEAGRERSREHALGLARKLAEELAARGLTVAPRGDSTLVSFAVPEPKAFIERLATEERMVLRDLPGTPYVRASVGGWTAAEEIDRLIELASAA